MWWTILLACADDGPERALRAAEEARGRGDLAAFEAVVDVEALAPEIAETCASLMLREHLAEAQFQPSSAWQTLGREFGDAIVVGSFDQPENRAAVVDTFRAGFPNVAVESCPWLAFEPAHTVVERTDDAHAIARVPVRVDGAPSGAWELGMERGTDGAWRVVSARGEPVIAAWEAREHAAARSRAVAIAGDLVDGGPHDDWEALANFVDHHPELRPLSARQDALYAPFVGISGPARADDVGFFRPSGWFRNRHVGARIANDQHAPATYVVRFTFADAGGAPVRSAGGARDLVVHVDADAAGTAYVTSRAGGMAWGAAVSANAEVIEVRWADGRTWRHPAVDAGAWSTLPTNLPS